MNEGYDFMDKWKKQWYIILVGFLVFIQAAVFLLFRDESYIAVHDNLDLFLAHFQIMKRNHAFFSHNTILPMVGGVSRDAFGSELSLYNILYFIFPSFVAYMIGYAFKIAIGFSTMLLLAKDIYKEKFGEYKPILFIIALAFGLIPVFPAYGIAFTSVPLLVYFLRRIYRSPSMLLYAAVFCYPLISYFSYFGFFILAYLACGVVILWVKDKKFPRSIFTALLILALGYICFEYRLFKEMLFSDNVTIRGTMVNADLTFLEMLQSVGNVFKETIFHAQDSHYYVVLPVCIIGIIIINYFYIKRHEYKKIATDSCNLILLFIIFNCIIYGLYDFKAFRDLFELVLPPLKGFQFNPKLYFKTFLWYELLFLILKRLYDLKKKGYVYLANIVAVLSVSIVMFMPQVYNDFYYTCYNQAYKIIKHQDTSNLNFREFYSENLFLEIKNEIHYDGEWAVAYGMHPAVLEYNGISTLDGYLGLYSQEYKEKFRRVIAPALEQSEEFKTYYDDWGARAYIFSGAGENTYKPVRNFILNDTNLYIDSEEFKNINGKYIFSRIEISNIEELQLECRGVFQNATSPYTIYVYEAK